MGGTKYVLVASRTSGESNATIIVGEAMRGAAWVAGHVVRGCCVLERGQFRPTQPRGSSIAVEVVDL